jgi:adenylate cyclase
MRPQQGRAVKRLTLLEVAADSGVGPERIRHLIALDILRTGPDGLFLAADVQVVRIVEALSQAGISAEQVGELIRVGEFSFRLTEVAFPEPPSLTSRTFDRVANELGIPIDVIQSNFSAAGLPRPAGDDLVREDDVEALGTMAMVYKTLGGNKRAAVEPNRHLGENLRRIAQSQVQFFRTHLERPMLDSGMPFGQFLDRIADFNASFVAASITAINWLYKRHLEHFIMQEIIEGTENALERSGMSPRPPAKRPTIAFLDLTSYTSLTEERGDEVAADLTAQLSDVVTESSRSHGGYPVKFLGDGVMFYFSDSARAALCGLEFVDELPKLGLPPARVGIAAGPVVFRDGDYFGRTVNTAARITDYARPSEVLLSEQAVAATQSEAQLAYVRIGSVSLKGMAAPAILYRAVRDGPL